jgi:hypothetical protein
LPASLLRRRHFRLLFADQTVFVFGEGKSNKEALRRLKRRFVRVVPRALRQRSPGVAAVPS